MWVQFDHRNKCSRSFSHLANLKYLTTLLPHCTEIHRSSSTQYKLLLYVCSRNVRVVQHTTSIEPSHWMNDTILNESRTGTHTHYVTASRRLIGDIFFLFCTTWNVEFIAFALCCFLLQRVSFELAFVVWWYPLRFPQFMSSSPGLVYNFGITTMARCFLTQLSDQMSVNMHFKCMCRVFVSVKWRTLIIVLKIIFGQKK